MVKVSDYIFDFLLSKGVDTIFMVSGGAAAHLMNSVKEKGIKYICCQHEQACAMAAEGYARIANKPACVLVTNGPGSSNTITGVLGAYQDSIPMIIISGQVPVNQTMRANLSQIRQLGVQECNIISMVKNITKYSIQLTSPNFVQEHLNIAYDLATTGRKGPVWLDVPLDIQNSQIEIKYKDINFEPQTPKVFDYSKIINLITNSKRPLIITGNGIHLSKSEGLFNILKDRLQIPVISTWTSKDLMSFDDPLFVGTFGILGERAANFAVQNADLLLILGSRMSIPNVGYQSHLFSPNSIKIMVDIDQEEMDKPTIKIDYPINEDLHKFMSKLLVTLTLADTKSDVTPLPSFYSWIKKTQEWKKKYPVFQSGYEEVPNRKSINSYHFMELLSKELTSNHIIVTDMGTSYTCTMQALKMNGKNRLFTSSACCSMGFGLPGAIGAYFADPTKEIILIAGDGGFQMNIQELQTIVHYKIPIKIFILNNKGYLAISLMQDNLFKGNYIGANKKSGVSSPDFVKVAKAYGIDAVQIANYHMLGKLLENKRALLIEVPMIENQPLIPRVQSSKKEDGSIISNSLENMFPYLDEEEMKNIML